MLSDRDLDVVGGASIVETPGYLAHDETVALLRSADLLFLPMHDLPEGRRATIVPGKTYEYLASRRLILAVVPDGDARDLLAHADGDPVPARRRRRDGGRDPRRDRAQGARRARAGGPAAARAVRPEPPERPARGGLRRRPRARRATPAAAAATA